MEQNQSLTMFLRPERVMASMVERYGKHGGVYSCHGFSEMDDIYTPGLCVHADLRWLREAIYDLNKRGFLVWRLHPALLHSAGVTVWTSVVHIIIPK